MQNRILSASLLSVLILGHTGTTFAHPGSGIVVDDQGRVWFMDTGFGLWQIDALGQLSAHGGPGGHFLTMDRRNRFERGHFSALAAGDVEISRSDPTLVVGTSYPVTVGTDGAFYYPQVATKGRVRMMRMEPGQPARSFAELPAAREVGYDGKPVEAEWIWGLAAGPDGSLYYTEQRAVRRIGADGKVSTVAENIVVPECERPPAAKNAHAETGLYGLDVAADGSVYVAAFTCSAVLKISRDGEISVPLRATDRWSPMGVAIARDTLYVLEYDLVATDDRADWKPRVRRLDPDGTVTIVAQVDQRPAGSTMGVFQRPQPAWVGVPQRPRKRMVLDDHPMARFAVAEPFRNGASGLAGLGVVDFLNIASPEKERGSMEAAVAAARFNQLSNGGSAGPPGRTSWTLLVDTEKRTTQMRPESGQVLHGQLAGHFGQAVGVHGQIDGDRKTFSQQVPGRQERTVDRRVDVLPTECEFTPG